MHNTSFTGDDGAMTKERNRVWEWIVLFLAGGSSFLALWALMRQRGRTHDLGRSLERLEQLLREQHVASHERASDRERVAREEWLQALHRQTQQMIVQWTSVSDRIEQRLVHFQTRMDRQLDLIRHTVDEKLQTTLERRLHESFSLVSERLALVHEGLGEMQQLASGIGDLKRVLMNVKTRGTLGEVQLQTLLEQVLTPQQYEKQAPIRPERNQRCDFVVKLPNQTVEHMPVLLPIDAKFPLEEYARLQEAEQAGRIDRVAQAQAQLESRLKQEAKSIQSKYIDPPYTTDFALLFLPTEGLYAEVLRRPGLWETLHREYRVIVAGPTTMIALLHSLQVGFRTIAMQQRSEAIGQMLRAVKNEFDQFSHLLVKTHKKLHEATTTLDQAQARSRQIVRQLDRVDESDEDQDRQRIQEEASS